MKEIRLSLLRDAINKRWPGTWTAVTSVESEYLAVSYLGPPYQEQVEFVGGNSDQANANWIVWCMERIDELGGEYDCRAVPRDEHMADALLRALKVKP